MSTQQIMLDAIIIDCFLPIYGIWVAINGTTYTFLIPKRPNYGCPKNSYGCIGNDCNSPGICFCEEHCSWKKCRLFDIPLDCLREVNSVWNWDLKQKFWVAQLGGIMTKEPTKLQSVYHLF